MTVQSREWLSSSKIPPLTRLHKDPGGAHRLVYPFASLLPCLSLIWGKWQPKCGVLCQVRAAGRRLTLKAWYHQARAVLPSTAELSLVVTG